MKMSDLNLVVIQKQDVGRDVLRDILRRCGLKSLQMFSSGSEMLAALKTQVKKWNIIIVDSAQPDALDLVKKIRESGGASLKILILFSGPTKEEVVNAIQAGVNDFLTMPFSQATVEEKLNKLMGVEKKTFTTPPSIFQRKL
ncbi:MAG: response regulator [Candidatus Tectomicrobia bacterium]|uniref:Response regulator n=1 Tax=Tectimicrobiota bacterium TaxID=2528274 RepID=A0A932MQZ1_UNCTE|nr:response regulator [Candidatus Tectomicrobia bacterium]